MFSLCIKCNDSKILNYLKTRLLNSDLDNLVINEHQFKIFRNIIIHYTSDNVEVFYYHFCKIFSELIVNYIEPLLIKRIIAVNYFYFNQGDISIVLDEFALLKKKRLYDKSYVDSILFSSIYDYIIQNNLLVISGFVDFRLKSYINYLENLVSEAINQYIIDKEYINFVNLLKNYIDSKVPNDLVINLVYINSNGILLSDKGSIIELESFNNSYLSDFSFSTNDYVLNTLIGLLPRKILVHLISPKDQFIQTIESIFSNKVSFCKSCELCKAYKTLKLK